MQRPSSIVLSTSVVILIVSGWLYGQTASRGHAEQVTSGPSRFTITSTDEGTILLDSATGDTWLFEPKNERNKEAVWLSVRRTPTARPETTHGSPRPDWARLSPFTQVRCLDGDKVKVEYDGKSYELLSIDDFPTADILKFSRKQFGERWEKRFVEDIVEVLAGMGKPPGTNVKLSLRDPKTAKTRTVDRAPLTSENRTQVYLFHNRNR